MAKVPDEDVEAWRTLGEFLALTAAQRDNDPRYADFRRWQGNQVYAPDGVLVVIGDGTQDPLEAWKQHQREQQDEAARQRREMDERAANRLGINLPPPAENYSHHYARSPRRESWAQYDERMRAIRAEASDRLDTWMRVNENTPDAAALQTFFVDRGWVIHLPDKSDIVNPFEVLAEYLKERISG